MCYHGRLLEAKSKELRFILFFLLDAVLGFITPCWSTKIFMHLNGSYNGWDWGGIAPLLGSLELFIWLAAVLSTLIYFSWLSFQIKRQLILIPLAGFLVFSGIGMLFLGGWGLPGLFWSIGF